MSSKCISERMAKLRSLRDTLCKKQSNWSDAFDMRDWIVVQLRELLMISQAADTSQGDVESRISDILCVLDPDDGDTDV